MRFKRYSDKIISSPPCSPSLPLHSNSAQATPVQPGVRSCVCVCVSVRACVFVCILSIE
jgi:hypothetical protein